VPHEDRFELAPIAPEFFVPDVDAAVAAYQDVLGYTLLRKEGAPATFAIGHINGATIMFMSDRWYTGPRADLDGRGAGLDIRVMVPDVDAYRERIRAADWPVLHEIGDRDYGLRDFIARDPNGFRLRFASAISPR
jgi:catechol 2,3-dioxygenase-like lactoylglutathione lyase family enzyme